MGLFDIFKKSASSPPPATPAAKKVAGPAKIVADKRAQTYDRMEAIGTLAQLKTPEAAEALLKRFLFAIDPSITDQEEKEAAFQGVLGCGKDAVPFVRAFCAKAEVLTWPLRILRELLDDEEYTHTLLDLAKSFDIEYARNVEPKLQVIAALAEVPGDEVRETVERFLEDVNENVRFHAVQSTFAQGAQESLPALVRLLASEESVRIKNKVCEGVAAKRWFVPTELLETARTALRDVYEYSLSSDGSIQRR